MRYLAIIAVLIAACGGADTSTPDGTAQAFIDGAVDMDVKGLGKLFSQKCEGEFRKLVDGSASEKDMEGLKKMFEGATITETKVEGDTARVGVKLPNHPRGKETLNLVKEGDAWKIQGF